MALPVGFYGSLQWIEWLSLLDEVALDHWNTQLYELLKNYMFRVVANNESHLMLDAYSIEQIDRFETFTHEEKVNTAKICLLLLNELEQDHLKAYLEDNVSTVEQWKNEMSKILGKYMIQN